MREGFQFVAMARVLLREPNLVNRIRSDENAQSLCIDCNKCMLSSYKGTRCVLVNTGSPRSTAWGKGTVV